MSCYDRFTELKWHWTPGVVPYIYFHSVDLFLRDWNVLRRRKQSKNQIATISASSTTRRWGAFISFTGIASAASQQTYRLLNHLFGSIAILPFWKHRTRYPELQCSAYIQLIEYCTKCDEIIFPIMHLPNRRPTVFDSILL